MSRPEGDGHGHRTTNDPANFGLRGAGNAAAVRRRPKTAQAMVLRARMMLACAEGGSNTAVAVDLGVSDETVGKWRSRFLERRLDGLSDEPRSGRARAITDDDVERAITLALETTPRDATHWSTRSMARRCSLSHNTDSRIWRAFGLQPHRTAPSSCRRTLSSLRRCGTSNVLCLGLYLPPGPCVGPVRGREVPDLGVGPHPSAVAHALRTGGTAHPQLPAPRDGIPVRRPGRRHRQGD